MARRRPVTKFGSFKAASASDSSVVEFYPKSNVLWKSTIVSIYKYQWITTVGGEAGVTWRLQVGGADVTELHMARLNLEPSVLVIPWLDGLRFSGSQRVGWTATFTGQLWVSATFIGSEDPP